MSGGVNVRGTLAERRSRWIAAVIGVLILATSVLALATTSWANGLADEQRLLPGTVVAGVDVGGRTFDEASDSVSASLAEDLDRTLRIVHGEREWTVTPRQLAATADASAAVRAALDHSGALGVVRLATVRWLGARANISVDAAVTAPEARLGVFTRGLAEEIDVEVRNAAITWNGDDLDITPSVVGLEVDRSATMEALRTAIGDGGTRVDLPVTETPPEVPTELAESALPPVGTAVNTALDRSVSVTDGEAEWRVSARDLGAAPLLDDVVPAAYAAARDRDGAELGADHDLDADVGLSFDEEALDGYVAELAGHTDVPARDASLDWSSGWIERVPGRDGLALDRQRAADDLVAALRGAADRVELQVGPARPRVTLDDYRHVLLVRQNERMLYLYVDGEITHEWPVAVGTSGQPTPTGEFRVGAKRSQPTWHNPAPTTWGRNMPRVIGPGPDNPLGLRALNWNRNGHDTLIRFHGTPQEHSIGQAASAGCVRMFNPDVIELYDLVPSGAAIVSIREPNPRPIDHGDPDDEAEGDDGADGEGDSEGDDEGEDAEADD